MWGQPSVLSQVPLAVPEPVPPACTFPALQLRCVRRRPQAQRGVRRPAQVSHLVTPQPYMSRCVSNQLLPDPEGVRYRPVRSTGCRFPRVRDRRGWLAPVSGILGYAIGRACGVGYGSTRSSGRSVRPLHRHRAHADRCWGQRWRHRQIPLGLDVAGSEDDVGWHSVGAWPAAVWPPAGPVWRRLKLTADLEQQHAI
jgi:hypothetical protein